MFRSNGERCSIFCSLCNKKDSDQASRSTSFSLRDPLGVDLTPSIASGTHRTARSVATSVFGDDLDFYRAGLRAKKAEVVEVCNRLNDEYGSADYYMLMKDFFVRLFGEVKSLLEVLKKAQDISEKLIRFIPCEQDCSTEEIRALSQFYEYLPETFRGFCEALIQNQNLVEKLTRFITSTHSYSTEELEAVSQLFDDLPTNVRHAWEAVTKKKNLLEKLISLTSSDQDYSSEDLRLLGQFFEQLPVDVSLVCRALIETSALAQTLAQEHENRGWRIWKAGPDAVKRQKEKANQQQQDLKNLLKRELKNKSQDLQVLHQQLRVILLQTAEQKKREASELQRQLKDIFFHSRDQRARETEALHRQLKNLLFLPKSLLRESVQFSLVVQEFRASDSVDEDVDDITAKTLKEQICKINGVVTELNKTISGLQKPFAQCFEKGRLISSYMEFLGISVDLSGTALDNLDYDLPGLVMPISIEAPTDIADE